MEIENKDSTTDMTNSPQQQEVDKKYNGTSGNPVDTTITDDTNATIKQHDQTSSTEKEQLEEKPSMDIVDSLKLSFNETEPGEQQDTEEATSPFLIQDCVLIIIMSSSIIDKHVTIKGLKQHGYTLLDQQSLQLSPKQIDTLYDYDVNTAKSHYQQLYEGWKQASASDPVEVVLLGKVNAVESFQVLVNIQNSTKKKNRILDPSSVYASNSQENVKRDINMLLGTQGSNNCGESVSSATVDDTVAQPSPETMGGTSTSTEQSIQQPSISLSHSFDNTNLTKSIYPDSINDDNQQQEPATMDETTALDNVNNTQSVPLTTLEEPETATSMSLETETTTTLPTRLEEKPPVSSHSQDSDNQLDESTESLASHQTDESINNNSNQVLKTETSIEPPVKETTISPASLDITADDASNSSNSLSSNSHISSNEEQQSSSPSTKSMDDTTGDNDKAPAPERKKESLKKKDAEQHIKKKQSLEGKSATKKVTTSAPSPPVKSKLRATTARPTKPTDKQSGGADDLNNKKKATDETKKKVHRIPRVALLASQPYKTPPAPLPTEDQQQQVKPKSKISRGSIARLTAPTASSARRRQSTTITTPTTPTEPTKGMSTTATVKMEQRKKRSDTTTTSTSDKNEAPTTAPSSDMTTTKPTTDISKATAAEEKIPTPPAAESSSAQLPPEQPSTLVENKKQVPELDHHNRRTDMPPIIGRKMLIIQKAKATTGAPDTTTTAIATITPPCMDKITEKDRPTPLSTGTTLPSGQENEKDQAKVDVSPQSPAESSTTSSRPHTPVQHPERGSPTTTATTTTGMVTLDTATPIKSIDNQQPLMGNTSKVKDILGRFM